MTPSPPSCQTRRCRPTGTHRSGSATTSATRWRASGCRRRSRSRWSRHRWLERFGPLEDALVTGEGEAGGRIVHVTNPLSSQHSVMRQSLIGSLLEVVSTNTRLGQPDVAIFEIGKGYGATADGDSTHEWWRLGLALTGAAEVPAWDRPARAYDLDDAKGIIELDRREPRLRATDVLGPDRRPEPAPWSCRARRGGRPDLGQGRRGPPDPDRRPRPSRGSGPRRGAGDRGAVRRLSVDAHA